MGTMGNVMGAFIAALIIGVAEAFGGLLIGGQLKQVVSMAIFILILLFQPQGLFGRRCHERYLANPRNRKAVRSPAFWRSALLDWDKIQLFLSLVLIVLFALSPLVINSPYYLGIIILTVIYAYVGLAWNIVGGFAGQLLIGHVTFFGSGRLYHHPALRTLPDQPVDRHPAGGDPGGALGAHLFVPDPALWAQAGLLRPLHPGDDGDPVDRFQPVDHGPAGRRAFGSLIAAFLSST